MQLNFKSVLVVAFVLCFGLSVGICSSTHAAEKINIWSTDAATLKNTDAKDIPTLDLYLVKSETPVAAILVIPGGGYKHHSPGAWSKAKLCQKHGVAAFVLKYRLPSKGHRYPLPLDDAQRAMRLIHHNAKKWNIDPTRIGVTGGSSGGHLASLLCNSNDKGNTKAKDPIDRQPCRPGFAILVQPVVTFLKPHAHWPSRVRMLGDVTDDQAKKISPELLVTTQTPPTALLHGSADRLVPPENSKLYAAALKAKGVKVETTYFDGVAHVFSKPLQDKFEQLLEEFVPKK